MAGKGDIRRPAAISDEEFAARWRAAFAPAARRTHKWPPPSKQPPADNASRARRIGQQELPLGIPCE